MSNTAEDIKQTIAEIVKLENAKKHFEVLNNSITEMKNELAQRTVELSKGQDDIEKLEKLSMASIFHKVLGNKEEKLEKERQEYLTLALKLKELKQSISLSEYEAEIVKEKALTSDQLNQKLSGLKALREKEIIDFNEPSKATLLNILKEIDACHKFQVELNEAFEAGENAKEAVHLTAKHLSQAMQFGEWDMIGHNSASYSKHGAIDDAARAANQAQKTLRIYNKELADIGVQDNLLSINVQTFSSFTDVFFDNLITDWIIQNKIKTTLRNVQMTSEKIALIQQDIKLNYVNAGSKLKELMELKDKAVMK
jgi:hypothetical protein